MGKAIILYYSWLGSTETVARELNKLTGYPMEQIKEVKPRTQNFFKAAMSAVFGQRSKIEPLEVNLDDYDDIILGTQVWVGSLTPAINQFIHQTSFQGKNVWIFMTKGLEKDPVKAMMTLKKKIEKKGEKVKDFLQIKSNWSIENPIGIKPEDIKETLKDWLYKNQFSTL